MIFSNGAVAIGGVVSQSVICSDGVMPPGVLPLGLACKKKCLRPLLNAGRVGMDER